MKALAGTVLAAALLLSSLPASAGGGQDLFEGWNEVNPWGGPTTANVRNTISTLNASVSEWNAVAKYDEPSGVWHQTFHQAPLPAFNTLAGLLNGEAYWIFVPDQAALTYFFPGGIAGELMYPSEGIPPLSVVFTNVDTGDYWWLATDLNQTDYAFVGALPPGSYHVVAYVTEGNPDFAGGYSEAVPCGLSVECTDHTLIDVVVVSGETNQGVTPGDWYAPAGAFPSRPPDVP